jgi:catechol-2,3-dioxygenase
LRRSTPDLQPAFALETSCSRLRRLFASAIALVLAIAAAAQVDMVVVFGTVKDFSTAKKIDGVTVTVFKNGGKLVEVPTNASGKYEVNLDYGAEYKLLLAKKGYVSKNIVIDTRNIPEEDRSGGHGMNIDFTLMAELPGVDFSVLLEPFGKAKYDKAAATISWDIEYTTRMRDAQAKLLKEYEERKKREANAEAEFAKLMTAGNAAMTASDFKKAVASFTDALTLKPNDAVATAKLSDARMRLEAADAEAKRAGDYAALIKEADALFGKKSYEAAKAKYEEALDIKENEPHPKQRIREIDGILAELAKKAEEERKAKELNEKYQAAIAAADAAFKSENWDQATGKYTEAAGLKPEEKYPKDQIALIAQKKAEAAKKAEEERKAKELNEKYQALIASADVAFKAASWDIATGKYTEASALKPDEKYPKDQLALIAQKKADEAKKAEEERLAKELQQKYQAAIAQADIAFTAARYDEAEAKYNEALGFKPEEKYPKDQLAAIGRKRDELAKKAEEERKAKELDEQYKALLEAGMRAGSGEQWDEAIAKYTEASALKPKEQYPKDQIALMQRKKEEAAKKAEEERKARELQAQYDAAIAAADGAFGKEEWDAALAKYNEAAGLKPAEKYPKDRIALIAQKKAEAEERRRQAELQRKYDEAIAAADNLFGKEDYAPAKAKYQEALGLKPAEQYPKDRIAEADARIAEKARREVEERKARERDAKYAELIARADKSYAAEKLSAALGDYKDAAALKPQEQHPKDRIADIESRLDAAARAKAEEERLAREKADRDKRYADLIAAADRDFTAKRYDAARNGYSDALGVKPDESHPKNRLAEIESILAEQARKAAADKEAAERAAAERAAKEEADRLAAQLAAQDRARAEEEARRKREEEAELQRRYQAAITAGDLAFQSAEFDRARERFNEALGLKPQEKYPKERLAAIDAELDKLARNRSEAERLAEQRRREEEERRRREAEEAERRRKADADERARLDAERAAQAERDAEARRLEEERQRRLREEGKALEERYRSAIVRADEALAAKEYARARGLYAEASDLKPSETYPLAKIEQIDRLLAEQERLRQEAELAAERARKEQEEQRSKRSTTVDSRKELEAEQFLRDAFEREEREKWERIRKLREDLAAEDAANAAEAAARRDAAVQGKTRLEEQRAGLYRGDETRRQVSAEQMGSYKDELEREEARRRERNKEQSGQQHEAAVAQQERRIGDETVRAQRHAEATATAAQEATAIRDAEARRASASAERSTAQRAQVERVIEQQAGRQRAAQEANADRLQALEEEKRAAIARDAAYARANEQARERAKERIDATPTGHQRAFADYNQNRLALEYPQGVTEESYTEGNKVIIRRVVVNGNKADEYSKVIAKWGTFYFKNGQSITEAIWTKETEG